MFDNVFLLLGRGHDWPNSVINPCVCVCLSYCFGIGFGFQGHREWVTEVNVLGIVEHQNLVKLVGYCADDDERGIQRLLIYEYMPNKSVEHHLSHRAETPLPWSRRLKIAQDAARGLTYLHEEMDFQVYRSVVTSPKK